MCLQCLPFLTRFHPSPLSPRQSRPSLSPPPQDNHLSATWTSVADAPKIPPLKAAPYLQPTDATQESSEAFSSAASHEPQPPAQGSCAIQAFPAQETESTVEPSDTPQLVSQEDDSVLEPSEIPEAPAPNVSTDPINPNNSLTESSALCLQQDPFDLSHESSYYSTHAIEDPAEQDRPLSETSSHSSTSSQDWSDNVLSLPNENVENEPVTEEDLASGQGEKLSLYVQFPHSALKPLLVRPGKAGKKQEHLHRHRITKHLHDFRKQVKEEGQRHFQNLFTSTKNQES